jgi:small-conductance mechanosensitive channel
MNTETKLAEVEIRRLMVDLLSDLHNVNVLWQVAGLVLCLTAAWWVTRLVRRRIDAPPDRPSAEHASLRRGLHGITRILFPLSALILVALFRGLLRYLQPEIALLNVAIPLLTALLLVGIGMYILNHLFAPSSVIRIWERTIAWAVWIGLALYLTGALTELLSLMDAFAFRVGRQRISLLNVVQGIVSVAVTVVIALWIGKLLEARLMGAHALDLNLRVVLSKLMKTVLVVVAVLVALPAVGIDVTVLSVFSGAIGVGIGFGLQKIAANYLSGFALLLDRSVSLGALVTIDGYYGEVTRLTSRYLVLKGQDGTEAIIPNERVITSVVINHSYTDRRVRVDVPIQVSYQSDVERALVLMEQAARAHPRVVSEPAPGAILKAFADSGIDLELYAWIDDPEAGKGNLRSDLNRALLKSFSANGIAIPFPQREIRIVGADSDAAPQPHAGGSTIDLRGKQTANPSEGR